MKAIVYHRFGTLEELKLVDLPQPTPGKGQILLRPVAISMNPRDVVFRQGALKLLTGFKFPKLTGSDVSGIVEEVGSGVTRFKKGDAVFGYAQDLWTGMSAELILLPEKYLARKPNVVSHVQASTLGCAYLTALQGLRDKAKLKPGQEVLVYGASGGVGTAVIQLAKYFGARVTAVSNSRNEAYCLGHGADRFIAYDQQDPFQTDHQYNVFFQVFSKGRHFYHKAKRVLDPTGTFITLIPNPLFEVRRLTAKPRFEYIMVKTRIADLEFLAAKVVSGDLLPHVSQEFPFAEMKEAHRVLESGHALGKLVVRLDLTS